MRYDKIWRFKHMFQSIINFINTKNIHSYRIHIGGVQIGRKDRK